jgi:hypothetical protein
MAALSAMVAFASGADWVISLQNECYTKRSSEYR